MSIAVTTRTIQLIVAPVIMITASGVLTTGILGHYAAINDRARTMVAERLSLLRDVAAAAAPTPTGVESLARERLRELDVEIPQLLRRHQLVHQTLVAVYAAIAAFIASMFVIAAAALTSSPPVATAALFVFLGGTAFMLGGIVVLTVEIRISRDSLRYEAERVLQL